MTAIGERNTGRPLNRAEKGNLAARLALVPAPVAEQLGDLEMTPGGRSRLRVNGYCARLSPAEVRAAARAGAGVPEVGGVPVDLDAIVRNLGRSERGRGVLKRRDLTP